LQRRRWASRARQKTARISGGRFAHLRSPAVFDRDIGGAGKNWSSQRFGRRTSA
jgi:hypothetical protein